MKPISLTIDGINSFYERQVIDFRFDGLFCISGDTGSGKTTILDCIIIALYGSSKRTSNISDYINLRRDKAEIRLIFETSVDGKRCEFEVVRMLGKTSNKAKLTNLTTGETVAEQTEKVNAAIYEMLALSRDDFTQVVILEQGKFGKFLSAGKKERNNTVGNLFKLHRYRDLGKKTMGLLNGTKDKLENVDSRLAELDAVTQSALNEKKKFITNAKNRRDELNAEELKLLDIVRALEQDKRIYDDCVKAEAELELKRSELATLQTALDEATIKVKRCTDEYNEAMTQRNENSILLARAGELKRLLDEAQKRGEAVEKLREEWKNASGEVKKLNEELGKDTQKRTELLGGIAQIREELFSIADFCERDLGASDIKAKVLQFDIAVASARNEFASIAKKEGVYIDKVRDATDKLALSMQAEAAARSRKEQLEKEVEELTKKFESERRLEAAHYIRAGLKEGDVCPVCGGTIKGEQAKTFFTADKLRLDESKTALAWAVEAFMKAQNGVHSFATALDESKKVLSEAQKERADAETKLASLMEKVLLPEKLDKLNSLSSTLCDKSDELVSCENEIKVLAHRCEDAQKRADEIRLRGESERAESDRLLGEIGKSGIREEELAAASERENELEQRVKKLYDDVRVWESKKNSLAERFASVNTTVEMLAEKIKEKPPINENELLRVRSDLFKVKTERDDLIAALARSEHELETMSDDLKVKRELEAQKKELKQKQDIYADIYKLVSGDKFIEYVAEEYILQFTESASTVLSDITRGKYTLSYHDGDFYVKDFLSGGMERKAGTLSGGETFLASLSLAIAISREIARFKTYEFFFLDEGFGTLDAQSLDTVADALTMLASETMVGVVTHRTELTDRIFDKITVLPPRGDVGSIVIRS